MAAVTTPLHLVVSILVSTGSLTHRTLTQDKLDLAIVDVAGRREEGTAWRRFSKGIVTDKYRSLTIVLGEDETHAVSVGVKLKRALRDCEERY